jgi:ATP-binding cassette, subfamily C, bacterial exporter for protease/lipase
MNAPATTIAAPAGAMLVHPTPAQGGFFSRSPIGRILWTFRKEFLWVCIFSAFANLLMLTPTIYMLQVFDRVMFSSNLMTLAALTVLLVVFSLLMAFAEWVRSRLLVRAGGRFDEALNRSVFAAAFASQLSNTRRNPTQPLTDLTTLRAFLTGNGVFAVVDTPWTVVFVAALFLMHPWLGWLSLAFVVLQLMLGFAAHRWSVRTQKAQQELALDSAQYLAAKFRNAETVEAMGMQGNLRRQWQALDERQAAQQAQAKETAARIQVIMKWVQHTQQGLMLSLGALLVIEGQIGAGAMVASNALMGNALRPVGLIVQIWSQFADARAAFVRLEQLIAAHPDEPLDPPADKVLGQVTLQGLKASAPGRSEPILKGLDVSFKAGEVVAILGPSGAGKSTLARCLLGIWPETEGRVLIDGHDLRSWPREVLGTSLGYLPQDVELFEGSIAENIARFAEVPSGQVIDAASRAGIHDMVLRMPKGYDTPIGEAGGILSGGQRQRVGLARAILNNPRIVVLDEPSANLDDIGEAALLRAVRELKAGGSTVFMIVHQQHLLAAADRVLMLDAGKITQFATVALAPAAQAAPATLAQPKP